jgi:opacity protein-like surface antigen
VKPFVPVLAAGFLLATPAHAGEWGIGVELGYGEQTFEPNYSFYNGRPDRGYTNRAYGVDTALFAEYRVHLSSAFSVGALGRVGGTPSKWKLSTSEPARLTYDIPVNVALSLVPALHVDDMTALFGELGLAGGYVQYRKESSVSSWYDQRGWRPGVVVGGGIERKLVDSVSARAFFRYTAYQSRAFDTTGPGGRLVERLNDAPSAVSWGLGLIYRL